ncbi:type VII secretion system-associated protein [Streptomyces sp. NPDC096136]|uniref:type VII secretion system-associated protein n=1 Tax=Streptomyces sp. NPDC096136 TaxID=3366076 RepID=UPI00380B642A
MSEPKMTAPPVTDAVRAEAMTKPGSWVYAIDRFFDPAGRVPPFGIIGAWKVDDLGHITGEFKHNPSYRPSPLTLGMNEPTDAVDAAIQRAAAGYSDDGAIRSALLDSILFFVPDGVPDAAAHADDTHHRAVMAYTNERQAPRSVPLLRPVAFRDLLARLPDHAILKLNPGSSASVHIPVSELRRAADG